MAMRVVEVHEAVQWFPNRPHPAVKTSVIESGLQPVLERNRYIVEELRAGKGNVGIIRSRSVHRWEIVKPGDWIVSRRGQHMRYSNHEFAALFMQV